MHSSAQPVPRDRQGRWRRLEGERERERARGRKRKWNLIQSSMHAEQLFWDYPRFKCAANFDVIFFPSHCLKPTPPPPPHNPGPFEVSGMETMSAGDTLPAMAHWQPSAVAFFLFFILPFAPPRVFQPLVHIESSFLFLCPPYLPAGGRNLFLLPSVTGFPSLARLAGL